MHGFCLAAASAGRLADMVTRREDATFGLPEVDRARWARLRTWLGWCRSSCMRAMVYTCRTVTARQLLAFGTVLDVVPAGPARAARDLAAEIAAKDGLIRLAKQSLNGIDPVDVKRSYRYEQGFTFELNLTGVRGRGPAGLRGRKAPVTTDRRAR